MNKKKMLSDPRIFTMRDISGDPYPDHSININLLIATMSNTSSIDLNLRDGSTSILGNSMNPLIESPIMQTRTVRQNVNNIVSLPRSPPVAVSGRSREDLRITQIKLLIGDC